MEINILPDRVEGVIFIYTINLYTYKARTNVLISVKLFNSQRGVNMWT